MGDKKGKKVPLFVEGVDINDTPLPKLLRLASKIIDDLIVERGERTRAQIECDIVRTSWQNTEKELEEAKLRLMQLHMQGESLDYQYKDPLKMIEEELKYVKYTVPMEVKEAEEKVQEKVDRLERLTVEEKIPAMLDKRLQIQKDTINKKKQLLEEVDAAGKDVVSAIDKQLAFSEEVLLKRMYNMLKSVSIRNRYLSTFYKVQMMKLHEEKTQLIADLEQNNNTNFLTIRDFFKRIIQNDIVLMFMLDHRLKEMQDLRTKKLQTINEMSKNIVSLKDEMNETLKSLNRCYRRAQLYEQNLEQYERHERLVKVKEKQIDELHGKMERLMKEKEESMEEINRYLRTIKLMKDDVKTMIDNFNVHADLKCFNEVFTNLMSLIKEQEKIEREHPGLLQEIKMKLTEETHCIKTLHDSVIKEMKFANDFIDVVNNKFEELGIENAARFTKTFVPQHGFLTGPSTLISQFNNK